MMLSQRKDKQQQKGNLQKRGTHLQQIPSSIENMHRRVYGKDGNKDNKVHNSRRISAQELEEREYTTTGVGVGTTLYALLDPTYEISPSKPQREEQTSAANNFLSYIDPTFETASSPPSQQQPSSMDNIVSFIDPTLGSVERGDLSSGASCSSILRMHQQKLQQYRSSVASTRPPRSKKVQSSSNHFATSAADQVQAYIDPTYETQRQPTNEQKPINHFATSTADKVQSYIDPTYKNGKTVSSVNKQQSSVSDTFYSYLDPTYEVNDKNSDSKHTAGPSYDIIPGISGISFDDESSGVVSKSTVYSIIDSAYSAEETSKHLRKKFSRYPQEGRVDDCSTVTSMQHPYCSLDSAQDAFCQIMDPTYF